MPTIKTPLKRKDKITPIRAEITELIEYGSTNRRSKNKEDYKYQNKKQVNELRCKLAQLSESDTIY